MTPTDAGAGLAGSSFRASSRSPCTHISRFFHVLLVAAALAVSPAATADERSDQKVAHALFDQGVALSDDGKWAEALAAFQKSNDLVPSLTVRFNIAATLRALGRYVEAKQTLEKILADAPSFTPPIKRELKADVTKLLSEVLGKVVMVEIHVTPPDASVEVDGAPLKREPGGGVLLDPGKHVFVVRAPDYETATVSKTLSSDTSFDLVAHKTAVVERRVEVTQETPLYARGWFLVTGGVVVAGAATLIVFLATRPKGAPAAPPEATVDRVIPASALVRF